MAVASGWVKRSGISSTRRSHSTSAASLVPVAIKAPCCETRSEVRCPIRRIYLTQQMHFGPLNEAHLAFGAGGNDQRVTGQEMNAADRLAVLGYYGPARALGERVVIVQPYLAVILTGEQELPIRRESRILGHAAFKALQLWGQVRRIRVRGSARAGESG